MLNDVDIKTLQIKTFNGADIGEKYVPPSHPTAAKVAGLKTYKGNCHCGNFKFSIKIPEVKKVRSCNCSICTRVSPPFASGMLGLTWQ